MSRNVHKSDGFGIIELIGALAIFAIAAIPLFSLEGLLLRRSSSALNSWSDMIVAKNTMLERERLGNENDSEKTELTLSPLKKVIFSSQPVGEQSAASNFSFARQINATVNRQRGNTVETTEMMVYRPLIKRDDKAEEEGAQSEKQRPRKKKKKAKKSTKKKAKVTKDAGTAQQGGGTDGKP